MTEDRGARQISVMRTTLRLDDELYRQAKARAATLGMSLTKFLEEAVRERLHAPMPTPHRRRIRLPVSSATGGLAAGFSTLKDAVAAADLADDLDDVEDLQLGFEQLQDPSDPILDWEDVKRELLGKEERSGDA